MSNIKISKEQYNEIIELYKNGFLQKEIAEKYGVSRMTINSILKKCDASRLGTSYKSRKIDFTDIQEKEICNMYSSGMSSVDIGKIFNCDHKTITKILDKYNIDRVGVGLRRYKLNENYFDKVDTPNKAYILGFFYADGSNSDSKCTITMSLQEEDKDILEAIRKEIGSEKPLEFLDYSNKHDGGYNYKNQYRLLMFSKHMCETLKNVGMIPNKSLALQWPTFLRDDLYSHFLRGYIDGDGYIQPQKWEHNVNFLSTYDFCNKAKEYIENKLDIQCRLDEAPCKNGITTYLCVRHKNQVKKFLDYIYQDAELYLNRKYNVYISKYCMEDNINNTHVA
jgi:DNA-binding CsgD family transcriptional regulator